MRREVVLTVAQSKRLIAKGVAQSDAVRRAMRRGMVAVAKGTTNTYVLEELTGSRIKPFSYTTGLTLPSGVAPPAGVAAVPDVVFRNGSPVQGLTVVDSVKEMQPGDVVIKGANALNYLQKVAGILVGHPAGGTIGGTIGAVVSRKVHLVIPIGLEKNIAFDILSMAREIPSDFDEESATCGLFPVTGTLITEIEALHILSGVATVQVGAGGVRGAEGAVWLHLSGPAEQTQKALDIIGGIQREEPFGGTR